MRVNIRRMTLDDLSQVVAIDQASFSLPWPERSFRFEITDNPAARCWVAELDGRIIGILVLWLIVDEAHIATIATLADFRRQGVARELLVHALKSSIEEGAVSAFLEVRESNSAALTMYRKHGFVETGRRPRYYKDNNEDAILMTLERLNTISS
ncbi:MAG: ribosomal protein S18-alanine N-acetyltransferase [Chloroflexi bacterium]|nr:ribosomal protein S18-alanine N-acetyltransferase [Chloroflexota bacterium]